MFIHVRGTGGTAHLARLLWLIFVLALPLSSAFAGRIAFVVGNDRYDQLGADEQLQKAVNDARAMASLYRGLGFEVIALENADRTTFARSWQTFLNRIHPGDVAVFFFSGHGVEMQGQNFLLPRDVPNLEETQQALLREQSIGFNALLDDLNGRSPQISLVILDACRNNPFAGLHGKGLGGAKGLSRVEPPKGTFVMYSAGVGQRALDRLPGNDPDPNSVYTRSLLPLLKTPGLSLSDIAQRLKLQVYNLARGVGHLQTPAYYDEVIGAPFCLNGPCAANTTAPAPAGKALGPGDAFRDCDLCPEMRVVPAGRFMMGSGEGDRERADNEGPVHAVEIPRPFAVGKFEVTFDEWDACLAAGGCGGHRPPDEGWGRGRRPVIHVSWRDAQAYAAWLGLRTGKGYRLLTEAEWEYVARAGTMDSFAFGDGQGPGPGASPPIRACEFANGADRSATGLKDRNPDCDDHAAFTAPVGSFKPNPFGLHDTAGNVWEWVADCWRESYSGAPADGTARTGEGCKERVMRGGSWATIPRALRPAFRAGIDAGYRDDDAGFRVARELE